MKNFLLTMLLVLTFSIGSFAQFTQENKAGSDTYVLTYTYNIDSAATLTSKEFSLDDFDGGISVTNPATFYFDNATDGAPATTLKIEIILWGVYNGGSYTYPLDTIIASKTNQGVDDSLGVLTLNKWSAPSYKITFVNAGGNGSGTCTVIFPKRENPRVSDIDSSH